MREEKNYTIYNIEGKQISQDDTIILLLIPSSIVSHALYNHPSHLHIVPPCYNTHALSHSQSPLPATSTDYMQSLKPILHQLYKM